jgi:nitronate monooxygenase
MHGMRKRDDWLDRLGLRHPLLQAPMAGVSTAALAAAVSNAGALGAVALGALDAPQARTLLAAAASLTGAPIQANVFCHRPPRRDARREAAWLEHLAARFHAFGAQPPATLREIYRSFLADEAMLEVLLQARPAAVSFHFGLPPRAWIARLREAGLLTFATVTSPAEAVLAEAAGMDVLVAQGAQAGGHRGNFEPQAPDALLGTFDLLHALATRTSLPLVATGGMMDGADIAAALAAGASAVQLGTAFVACPESAADTVFRSKLGGGEPTRMTRNVSGRAARGFANALFDLPDAPPPPDYPIAYDAAKALHTAAIAKDRHDYAVHWAGSGAARARALPAARLVEVLAEESERMRPAG